MEGVAPTIAALLHLSLAGATGKPLQAALAARSTTVSSF